MRSHHERAADAMVRLFKPVWSKHDATTGKRTRTRADSWWADYREDGKRHRVNLGTPFKADAELARARIVERLRRQDAGLVDPFSVSRSLPLAKHFRAFLVGIRASGATRGHVWRIRRCLARTFRAMGAK